MCDAAVKLTEERLQRGRNYEAMALLAEILRPERDPKSAEARQLLKQLRDGEFELDEEEQKRLAALNPGAEPRVFGELSRVEVDIESETKFIREKIDSIVIPEVVFEETPVSQAVDFLRTKSIELDAPSDNASQKGFSIRYHRPNSFDEPEPTVTWSGKNVNFLTALQRAIEPTALKISIQPHGVYLAYNADLPDSLFDAVFRVSPVSMESIKRNGTSSEPFEPTSNLPLIQKQLADHYLEKSSVEMPVGSTLGVFDAATQQLRVRNTAESLDVIAARSLRSGM